LSAGRAAMNDKVKKKKGNIKKRVDTTNYIPSVFATKESQLGPGREEDIVKIVVC
jgi:hypothetical protein